MGFWLFMHIIMSFLGTSPDDWACWQSNPVYVPQEPFAAACVLYADGNAYTPKLRFYLDWDGSIGQDIAWG